MSSHVLHNLQSNKTNHKSFSLHWQSACKRTKDNYCSTIKLEGLLMPCKCSSSNSALLTDCMCIHVTSGMLLSTLRMANRRSRRLQPQSKNFQIIICKTEWQLNRPLKADLRRDVCGRPILVTVPKLPPSGGPVRLYNKQDMAEDCSEIPFTTNSAYKRG